MRIGSLFAGVGGLELGLEMAGVGETAWQVEQSEFCRNVLARHWPEAERFTDVREVGSANLPPVDLVCGGFPCQPFSTASRGRRTAVDFWPEMRRIVLELRPRFVVAENVARDPIERAADALEREGYKATAIEVEAAVVGCPHNRVRWFMVADSNGNGEHGRAVDAEAPSPQALPGLGWREDYAGTVGVDDGSRARLHALGNAVIPQCAEVIGHIIMELA